MSRERSAAGSLRQEQHEEVRRLLATVQAKGARVWLEQEQLRYRAPTHSISQKELDQLRSSKAEIIHFLKQAAGDNANASTVTVMEAPLAFSQLQHWNFYDLGNHRAIRHLAAVRRLTGRLDADVLQRSVLEIVRRQDSLRTRFVERDGVQMQVISADSDWGLTLRDLTRVPSEGLTAEIQRQIGRIILEPVDVATGPLFALELLRLGGEEHLLVLAMEHIISDMWSVGLLLRDIFDVYGQVVASRAVALPKPSVQFHEYAAWQRSQERAWVQHHAAYWEERLSGFGRDRFPRDQASPDAGVAGWDLVPIDLGSELSCALRDWCRLRRTTVVMGVFVVYAALVQRWLGRDETVIRFESNGRLSRSLEQTIGYFTVPLFLRSRLGAQDTFETYLQRLLNEYCTALERSDSSYVEARLPRPEYSRNTSFNWIPHTPDSQTAEDSSPRSLSVSAYAFENPFLRTLERDTEPFVLFGQDALHTMSLASAEASQGTTRSRYGSDGNSTCYSGNAERLTNACERIIGAVYFRRDKYSLLGMERFAGSFVSMVEALSRESSDRIVDVALSRPRGEAEPPNSRVCFPTAGGSSSSSLPNASYCLNIKK